MKKSIKILSMILTGVFIISAVTTTSVYADDTRMNKESFLAMARELAQDEQPEALRGLHSSHSFNYTYYDTDEDLAYIYQAVDGKENVIVDQMVEQEVSRSEMLRTDYGYFAKQLVSNYGKKYIQATVTLPQWGYTYYTDKEVPTYGEGGTQPYIYLGNSGGTEVDAGLAGSVAVGKKLYGFVPFISVGDGNMYAPDKTYGGAGGDNQAFWENCYKDATKVQITFWPSYKNSNNKIVTRLKTVGRAYYDNKQGTGTASSSGYPDTSIIEVSGARTGTAFKMLSTVANETERVTGVKNVAKFTSINTDGATPTFLTSTTAGNASRVVKNSSNSLTLTASHN
ncbi:hypothetical protein ACR6HW_13730 [Fusibacter sp. JL298sf-3]